MHRVIFKSSDKYNLAGRAGQGRKGRAGQGKAGEGRAGQGRAGHFYTRTVVSMHEVTVPCK